ncbi:hypothetical protein ACOME3_007498 [Neoechinorhynchus agilis]
MLNILPTTTISLLAASAESFNNSTFIGKNKYTIGPMYPWVIISNEVYRSIHVHSCSKKAYPLGWEYQVERCHSDGNTWSEGCPFEWDYPVGGVKDECILKMVKVVLYAFDTISQLLRIGDKKNNNKFFRAYEYNTISADWCVSLSFEKYNRMSTSVQQLVIYECAVGYAFFTLIDRESIEDVHCERTLQCGLDKLRAVIEYSDFIRFPSSFDQPLYLKSGKRHDLHLPPADTCAMNVHIAQSSKSCPRILRRYLKAKLKAFPEGLEIFTCSPKLSSAIELRIPGIRSNAPPFMLSLVRFVRLHLGSLLPNEDDVLENFDERKAQEVSTFTACRIEASRYGHDAQLVKAIKLFDALNEELNDVANKIRDEYSLHFPELASIITDQFDYCRFVKAVGDKSNIRTARPVLREFLDDTVIERLINILVACPSRPVEMDKIQANCDQVIGTISSRDQLRAFIETQTRALLPNLSDLIGELTSARFLGKAGSCEKLKKWTSSDFQVAGLEKSMGIIKKMGGSMPPIGSLLSSAPLLKSISEKKERSRFGRSLASKIALVTRVDLLTADSTPSDVNVGKRTLEKLKRQLSSQKKVRLIQDVEENTLTEEDIARLQEMEIRFNQQSVPSSDNLPTVVDGRNYFQTKAAERVRKYNRLHRIQAKKRKYVDLDKPKDIV